MKKISKALSYSLNVCLILIFCYGLLKKNLYLIRAAGLLCLFSLVLSLYKKNGGKNKVLDIVLISLSGLLLILSIVALLGR